MKNDQMDGVFQALAHPMRRQILDIVKNRPGCNVNDVCEHFDVSRIAVMKHLKVLYAARLLKSEKEGRVRSLYFNVVPIQLIYDRWSTEYSAFWATQLTDMKYELEKEESEHDRAEEGRLLHRD